VNPAPQSVSIVTDISANLFALLILFLIILLAAREGSPATRTEARRPVELERELKLVERSPLSGDELFDLLYERREQSVTTRIDLLDQAIEVVSGRKGERFSSLQDAAPRLAEVAATSSHNTAGVYVFDHRFYRELTERLKALDWTWHEVSVPEALRDTEPQGSARGWSAGFAQLIAQPSDRAQFRARLAQLLQSASARRNDPFDRSWQGDASFPSQLLPPAFDYLGRWWQAGLNTASILGGLAFVIWIERRHKRARSEPS
jgi:hypothetical protein